MEGRGRADDLHARPGPMDQRRLERGRPLHHRERGRAEGRGSRHTAPPTGARRAHPDDPHGGDARNPPPRPRLVLQLGRRTGRRGDVHRRLGHRGRADRTCRGRDARPHQPLRPSRDGRLRGERIERGLGRAPAAGEGAHDGVPRGGGHANAPAGNPLRPRGLRAALPPRERAGGLADRFLVHRRRDRPNGHVRPRGIPAIPKRSFTSSRRTPSFEGCRCVLRVWHTEATWRR